MSLRAPIHVVEYQYTEAPDAEVFTRWEADERFVSAEFEDRNHPRLWAIVHRSTTKPGRWQVSQFDEDGAWGHCDRATANEALKEVPPRGWRLRRVYSVDTTGRVDITQAGV
jgi:creatinine amidohydrolase/Fe(II)-dependent formamide hydrolase-like protein